ncbi:proline-rich proteoglycan 2-like [Cloeon dipterum]|uniref:proline-rich proteoglycan 2-like n=1 Tax=Cloeon dipterum TaxID=197152 RepID=UPI00321FD2A9
MAAWWFLIGLAAACQAADRGDWVWGDNRRSSRIIDGPGTLSLNEGGSYGISGGKRQGIYNDRPGAEFDRYADGPFGGPGGFGRPPVNGPQGFAVEPPIGAPGGAFPPGPPPPGAGFQNGRPHVGKVPPYEDPYLKEPGLHTGGYDTCKCTLSFNCNSPGIKFGVCDEGKQYCCYNSHIAGSNRRPHHIGGAYQPTPAVLAGPGGPRDFPPGAPVPPPHHRPGPGGPAPHAGVHGPSRPPVPDVLVGPGGPYDFPSRPPFGGPVPYSAAKTKDF